jgi:Dolichyl-phosphate-mannose-protein mannosyltransferase
MTDRLARRLALAVLVGGVVLRFARLDADPYYYEWNGYITDEGRWIAHARALRLFGEIGSVGSALHLILAPVFQAGAYVVFALTDVSLWSARLVSALAGSALLVAFWGAFRRLASPPALLLALTMVAVEMDLVVLSRLAIPEVASMALSFAAFLVLVRARTGRGMLGGGILVAAAIGTKATVLPLAFIFGALVLARAPEGGLSRRRALAAYAAGVLVPAALAAGAVVAAGAAGAISLRILLRVLKGFVGIADFYGVVAFPFEDTLAPVLALWSLVTWLGCLGGLAARGSAAEDDAGAHLRAACLWAGAFAPLMFALAYFPSRYKLHILVPLAVIIAVGLTRLERAGVAGLTVALDGFTGVRRVAAAVLLSGPTALIAATALLALGGSIGLNPERLRLRYVVVLLALAAAVALVPRALGHARVVGFLVWLPSLWATGWLVVERLTVAGVSFWPESAGGGHALRWALLLIAGSAALAAAGTSTWPRGAGGLAVVTAALVFGGLGLVRLAPGYLDPHFSMRDSSRDLGTLLSGVPGSIRTLGGEALFSDNRLRYGSILGGEWPRAPADVLVLAGRINDPQDRLHREYRLIRQYAIYVSPEFILGEPTWSGAVGQFRRTTVRVYRRGGEGG